MKFKASEIEIYHNPHEGSMKVELKGLKDESALNELFGLKEYLLEDKLLSVEIKKHRQRRSLDANAYCWIISDKIAKAIGNTKEYVYKKAIRQVGEFEIVPIKNDALERWITNWECRGLGWQVEVMGKSKLKGYINTTNYFGSSVYDTKEMSKLLEELIYQAKELGIDTMTPAEKEKLISQWGGYGG